MTKRADILEAAATLFSQRGFADVTTRQVADVAGVNEVTIFRLFGTKAALADAALARSGGVSSEAPTLPTIPEDPEKELAAWATQYFRHVAGGRSKIRKVLGDLVERPALIPRATAFPIAASRALVAYINRLRRRGLIRSDVDPIVAAALLRGALFGDAMGRDIMPDHYPRSAAAAPRLYVDLVLAGLGFAPIKRRRRVVKRAADR